MAAVDVDEVWSEMGAKLEHMLMSFSEGEVEGTQLDRAEWMRMYTDVYNICVEPEPEHAEQLYERFRTLVDEHLEKQRAAIAENRDHALVKCYCLRFEAFVSASKYIRKITEYMHRFWIPQQINDNPDDTDVMALDELVLRRWDELVLQQVDSLLPVVLAMINESRQGDAVDWKMLAGAIKSFVTIGAKTQVDKPVELYVKVFEAKFLKKTREFYKKASHQFLGQNSVPDYMRKVEAWLKEEEERADLHLHKETKPKVESECIKVLIDDQSEPMVAEFVGLVSHDQRDDLSTLYKLLNRSKDGLRTVGKKLEGLIEDAGNELIKNKQKTLASDASKSADQMKKCLPLIKDLTALHGKYKELVEKCFSSNHIFVKALDQAFKSFVNNEVGGFNMSELLSFYCDHLMRSQKRTTERELEVELDKIVRLFCYLEDKDLFHESYRRMLSKRLLSKKDSNEELERTMISKLKENAGFSFTAKLEGMFNDMATSGEIIRKFKDHQSSNKTNAIGFDVAVQVLNSNHWPINQNCTLTLPKALMPVEDVFGKFYAETHQSRRLSWVHSQGSCSMMLELKRRHELTMSTYQACILLHFNAARTIAVKDLVEKLGITEEEVTKAVEPLMIAKHKVLLAGEDDEGNDTLSWNVAWTPEKVKLTFPQSVTKWTKQEADSTKKVVEVDRSFQIDAAIVRIMKTRRRFAHEKLIAEATAQLLTFFRPDPKQIKRRIEHLIEREYLERSGANSKFYHYIT